MVLPLLLTLAASRPNIVSKRVEYTAPDGAACEGYASYDASAKGARPLVIVLHDWNGIDGYEERRTKELAALGYVAFAADVYGKGVRPEGEARGQTSGRFYGDKALWRGRLKAGLDAGLGLPGVDQGRVGAIGYCFGGTGVLEMGRAGLPVKALVLFHGGLNTDPADDGKIRGRMLVLHGLADGFVKPAAVAAFESEMKAKGVSTRIVKYPGAKHAFTVPGSDRDGIPGVGYQAKADRDSFAKMRAFLAAQLGR